MKKIIKKLIALTKLLISRENNSLKEANPLKEAKQKQLDLCEERINILEKEFQRLAQLRNPNLSQQDIELKQRMIEERIGAVKNYISSGRVQVNCPLVEQCEMCERVDSMFQIVDNFLGLIQKSLWELEFSSCNFISPFANTIFIN